MDLFEYQGKQFFARYGMPVSPGEIAFTVEEAVAAAERIGMPVMVKAQVHTGGRGKAGGVKFAATIDDVREHAANILGLDISGHVVGRVWIELASDIAEEYYASFTLDRSARKHLGMLSAEGGVEIETVAEENPDAIAKVWIDPVDGLDEAAARAWVAAANLPEAAVEGTVDILQNFVRIPKGRPERAGRDPADGGLSARLRAHQDQVHHSLSEAEQEEIFFRDRSPPRRARHSAIRPDTTERQTRRPESGTSTHWIPGIPRNQTI